MKISLAPSQNLISVDENRPRPVSASPSRPLANRRLEEAIAVALGSGTQSSSDVFAGFRRALAVIAQERRYLLFLFMKRRNEYLTDYEIAEGTRDTRSNVAKNLHIFLVERVVTVKRDPETRIARFRINESMVTGLAELFRVDE